MKTPLSAIILIVTGTIFSLEKYFNISVDINWSNIWPAGLILWGVYILYKNNK